MLGNLMKECGVVSRLTKASENEIANIVTLLLGISIGATMDGRVFLTPQTLIILALGFLAICLDTACGVIFGKLMKVMTGGKINPLIGAAGISAYPMSARVVQKEGQKYNPKNYLLMHAMGANTGGQVGSVMAAAVMLSVLKDWGLFDFGSCHVFEILREDGALPPYGSAAFIHGGAILLILIFEVWIESLSNRLRLSSDSGNALI